MSPQLDRNEITLVVVDAWRSALDVESISPTDNFFNLGGNSLSALRVCSHLSGELGLQLSIRTLFEHSDVVDFVRELEVLLARSGTPAGADR
ncbi:phosphopantetheine-binding protein [Streptomyces sp. NPDC004546]|uniref:phosphopantetheine-binding protein n=1 Tax=unclassified Streptomyces TaxID=2593676 RepID=UPI0033A33731